MVPRPPSPPLQGDMLVCLLEAAHDHDLTFMSANLTYRRNRDRVVTMGFELHEKVREEENETSLDCI